VSENDVAETLVGTASSILKVIGSPTVLAQASHNNGTFVDSGPIPPVKDTATTYTVTLAVENGSNEITNAVVNTSLPQYMTWLDKTAGSGDITFNPTTRTIEWAVGDVDANAQVLASFQVSLFPLTLQVGTVPTLISEQRMRAVDRFTGTVVRDTNPPITTQFDDTAGSGRVRASEND
jgi:hypothetical protein